MTRSSNDNNTTALDSTGTGNFKITADVAGTYVFDLALTNNTTPSTIKPHYPQKVNYDKGGKTTTAFPTTPAYVTYNTAIGSAPSTTPAAAGYTFDTWVTTSGGSTAFDFATTKITSETTIYAKWTGQSKTLTVQALAKETSSGSYDQAATSITNSLKIGDTTRTSASVEVETSITVTAPATDPDGYVFVGWYEGTTLKSSNKSFSYTMPTDATILTARYDRKYTLTINKATDNGTVNATSKEVYYDDAPGSFTVTPSSGYRIKYDNCTNLSTYYTTPSASTGEQTMTGQAAANITSANKVDRTITIAFEAITPIVTYGAKKTDDGSTYSDGGGTVAAKEIEYTAGSGSSTREYLYLWWSGSDNPEQHTNKVNAVKATDDCYYGSFEPSGNFYFNITDSSSSATAGTQKLNSSTTADKDSNFADWTTVSNWGSYYIGKGYLNSGTTVYIKYDPTANKVTFRNANYSYTPAGSGGSSEGTETEIKTLGTSPDTITYNHRVRFTATANSGYSFVGWYNNANGTGDPVSTDRVYTSADLTDDYTLYALFKKQDFITLYNSYEFINNDWTFVAAPPRKVEIGSGSSMRTFIYGTGLSTQRGEEYVLTDSGTYYEGNKLVVFPGEKIKLYYSTLASSDAIKGVFYNNDIRYSTELEYDNLYLNRVKRTGDPPTEDGWETGDDDFGKDGYPFTTTTTLFADPDSYDDDAAVIINDYKSGYVAQDGMNEREHTLEWTAQGSYLNIDIELANKRQLHINGDDWSGITITGMNDEGYYYNGEHVGNQTGSETELKVALDNSDTTRTYAFAKTYSVKDKDGNALSGFTITPDNETTPTYYTIKSTDGMPAKDVYINIDVVEKYNMKLANIVVSDASTDKRTMLTETSGDTTSSTGNIGTITAIPKKGSTTGSDISGDGTDYYTYPDQNNADSVVAYTASTNNKYLKTGLNKSGSAVEAGTTITYTFTFATGKDAEYSFVGWYEGTLDGDRFTVNYNKKLSGKATFTYTPTKNTTVIAVGTRDIYIGGNFSDDQGSTASDTWTANRLKMEFDPTYVNPDDSSKKGRYYFKFDKVSANTEYKFRCYDTKSGTEFDNLVVWNKWLTHDNGGSAGYNSDNTDIAVYRDKYAYSGDNWSSHGGFMYTTATNQMITTAREQGGNEIGTTHTISASHKANGYDAPVYVYFYAYDGGISVNSTYQWSKAYVSAGRGIDCTNYADVTGSDATAEYNTPTVEVAATTVKGGTVAINDQTYGNEAIKKCTVQENNGQIVVTAKPGTDDLELHAFLVYNIDTKESEAVKEFTKSGSGSTVAFTGNITVPQNSSLYIVPIYKFTDTFISANQLEAKTVYVRTDNLDKNDWGGLVAMYSWGSKTDSGGWPGQLMIPSDDGNSFYGQLAFGKSDLSGVTFNNYTSVYGGNFTNFLGLYDGTVSDTKYSSYTGTSTHYINQAYDYREPISIIENIDDGEIYDSDEMDLTFALKMGNKNGLHFGETNYDSGYSFEYLTDRSGNYRVDLNGNKLTTQSTETYYVVCNYTDKYKTAGNYDFKDGSRDATGTKMTYGIEWTVYANDANHTKIGSTKLSAAYTDIYKSEMLTYVAKMLVDYGYPVSGKAVKIAYEDPEEQLLDKDGYATEAKRFSGQWYADGVNTIVNGNVRVGIVSDGAWLPSDTNSKGYGTATVKVKSGSGITIPNATTGEKFVTEDNCSGNSLVEVTKKHATESSIEFTVDKTKNFLGWYRMNDDGEFIPVGTNYLNQTINPSFNSDMTYYAFYKASATYNVHYHGRKGDMTFSMSGKDLDDDEMAANGVLDAAKRCGASGDVATQLAKCSNIRVFNHTLSFTIDAAHADNETPYELNFTATDSEDTYTLTVWSYDSSGTLVQKGSVTGTWSTALDVTKHASLGNGESLVVNKPSGHSNDVFIGWKKKDDATNKILSTHANFGYSITQNTAIEPLFGTAAEREVALTDEWKASIDKNVVTQELTNSTTGTIYNDTLVDFRYKADTAEQFDLSDEHNECGLLVVAQTGAAAANSTYSTAFNGITDTKMQGYVNTLVSGNKDAAKLKAATYGEAYALRIKATSLSRLNRIDLYQILDYATYSGGNYKVIAYTKVGDTYSYSDVISAVYTEGMKYPA